MSPLDLPEALRMAAQEDEAVAEWLHEEEARGEDEPPPASRPAQHARFRRLEAA